MSFREIIAEVESETRVLTVVDPPDESIVQRLRDRLRTRNVRVEQAHGATDEHPSGYAVLSDPTTGEVLAAVDCSNVTSAGGVGELASALDSTLFTSFDLDEMMAATREVEDRAWRVGAGTLHAGFQRPEAIAQQVDVYENLTASDLEIHTFVAPDPVTPEIEGVTVHEIDTREIRESWFVVFDGGPERMNACALLAEERGDPDERRFYGFWTYDPELVDRINAHLTSRYLSPEHAE